MSGSQLTTNWIRIATEGETIDGRRIEGQWLIDMADSYDPAVYTALIWPEHERWLGNYGEILELHSEKVDGLQRLFAKMCPSTYLIQANRDGQLLFCSIEPSETLNFRNTGKPYLEGLGVTNSPASVGTERLRFNSKKTGRLYGALEPLVFSEIKEEGTKVAAKNKDKKGAMSKMRRLFSIEDTPAEVEVDGGDKTLEEKVTALAEALSALDVRLTAIETKSEATAEAVTEVEETVSEMETAVEEVIEVVESAEFKALKAGFKEVAGKFSKLDDAITKLPAALLTNAGEDKGTNFSLV
nr:GPO family capsid scaffolding protein [Pragia fontium]